MGFAAEVAEKRIPVELGKFRSAGMRRVRDAGEFHQRNAVSIYKGAGAVPAVLAVKAVHVAHHIEEAVVDRTAVEFILIADVLRTHHQPYGADDAVLCDGAVERCAGMYLARRTARCAHRARCGAGLPPVCTGFSRARARHRHHLFGAARDGTERPGKSGAAPDYGRAGAWPDPHGRRAKEAAKFKSKVFLHFGDKKADARRLIAIMGMGIKHGNTVRVEVEGEDEAEAAAQLEAFFKANL